MNRYMDRAFGEAEKIKEEHGKRKKSLGLAPDF